MPVLHRLAGIAPPQIRRATASKVQKFKQETDPSHPLHHHKQTERRLKSRKSFITIEESVNPEHASIYRLSTWKEWDNLVSEAVEDPREELPNGTELQRKEWVALNRARANVGRTADNLKKWGLSATSMCSCGCPDQTMQHILEECLDGPKCTEQDLRFCSTDALEWIRCWSDTL